MWEGDIIEYCIASINQLPKIAIFRTSLTNVFLDKGLYDFAVEQNNYFGLKFNDGLHQLDAIIHSWSNLRAVAFGMEIHEICYAVLPMTCIYA